MKHFMKILYWSMLLLFGSTIALHSCKKDEESKSKEAKILSFAFNGLTPAVEATINGTSITATVPFGTNLTALVPTITISEKAVIAPGSGVANNFTNKVNYIVTAEDLVTKVTYQVTVSQTEPSDPSITAFTIPNAEVVLNQTAKTITIKVLEGTDVTALVPTITVAPEGAVVAPASGVAQNFTSSVTYSVTIGSKKTDYAASVSFTPIGFATATQVLKYSTTGGNPPFITGDAQRGMSMNADYIFIADKSVNEIHYFDRKGISTTVNKLSKGTGGIIAGGTFLLADVVTYGSKIFASNLANGNTTTPANLRVYKWDGADDAEPELFFEYSSNVRLGDQFSITGDPTGTGNLWFMPYGVTNGAAKIYRFDIVGGAVTNATTPVIINITVGAPYTLSPGNYPTVYPIGSGDNIQYLVDGANMPPALFDKDGNQLTTIPTTALPVRSIGAKLFEMNNAKYLAYVFTSDAATPAASTLVILNVTGANLATVLNSITAENVSTYTKYTGEIATVKNANVAADVSIYVDSASGKVYVAGYACNNGVIEVELSK